MADLSTYPQTAPSNGPGYPGNLTSDQAAKLKQLHAELSAGGYTARLDDPTLVRDSLLSHGSRDSIHGDD